MPAQVDNPLRLFPGDSSLYQANHTHSQQTAAPFPIVKATFWILSPSSTEICTTGSYIRKSPVTSLRALGTAGHVWLSLAICCPCDI